MPSSGSATMTADETTNQTPSTPPVHQKGKVDKLQSYLGLASTSIGVLGACGTAFVWIATNVFTGDVQVQTDKPVESVYVKVIDKKGQQALYYSKHVQLLPGAYHLEVGIPDKKPAKHFDTTVTLWKTTTVPYSVPGNLQSVVAGADTTSLVSTTDQGPSTSIKPAKKHWWQFWKHGGGGHDETTQPAAESN